MRTTVIQIIVSIFLALSFMIFSETENPSVQSTIEKIEYELTREYTLNEITNLGENVHTTLKNIPAALNTVTEKMAESSAVYGEPIDEEPLTETAVVYAVAGGTVSEVGTNEDIGNYIVIQHGSESESIYGNLSNIKVSQHERVKKGEIIGGYTESQEKEFYYTLNFFD